MDTSLQATMKNILIILIAASTLIGCYAGPQGELVGVMPREQWIQVNPYGMNYIHLGSYTMGPSDQDVPFALNTRSKTVTVPAFYADVHEISNNEYRQFVTYVKDSLFRNTLAEDDQEDFFKAEDNLGRELDRFIDKGYILNWETAINWEDEDIFDLLYDEYYLQGSDQFYNRAEFDTRKLNYRYWWINFDAAANKGSQDEEFGEVNSLNQLHSVRGHGDRS
jgi:formylglycine-generating enzyme required for sulfatase activity